MCFNCLKVFLSEGKLTIRNNKMAPKRTTAAAHPAAFTAAAATSQLVSPPQR